LWSDRHYIAKISASPLGNTPESNLHGAPPDRPIDQRAGQRYRPKGLLGRKYKSLSHADARAGIALANYAFADATPHNAGKLRAIVLFAFLASAGWFVLSEYVGQLKETVRYNSQGFAGDVADGYRQAIDGVAKSGAALKLFILLAVAIICSVFSLAWPFI
jgi:hypothetical protein